MIPILENRFEAPGGSVLLTDFMPVHRRTAVRRGYDVGTSRRIVRLVEGLEGKTILSIDFHPTFNYARSRTSLDRISASTMLAHGEGIFLSLHCSAALEFRTNPRGGLRADLEVAAGEKHWLVLTEANEKKEALDRSLGRVGRAIPSSAGGSWSIPVSTGEAGRQGAPTMVPTGGRCCAAPWSSSC